MWPWEVLPTPDTSRMAAASRVASTTCGRPMGESQGAWRDDYGDAMDFLVNAL